MLYGVAYGNIGKASGVGNERSMVVVQSNLEPMTSRIPKASSRTKSVSHTGNDINPTHVYHALESLGLFKSNAGRSISQDDVQRLFFRIMMPRSSLRVLLVYVEEDLESWSTSFLHIC